MQFGKAIGTACSSFAITNIDDIFVLVTFMAEVSTSKAMTPWKITIGQYLGFTVIIVISMIGFGVSLVLPSEPIGFLGFLPILLGVWNMFDLVIHSADDDEADDATEAAVTRIASMRSIFKVALVTLMNGGDNIGTYIPLFSQTKGAEIAVYVVVYYILVGVWCLAAWLVMKQRHILRIAEKYARIIVPILYVGLGIFILVKSDCYPWSIEHIDKSRGWHVGRTVMAVVTTGLLLTCIAAIFWWKWRRRKRSRTTPETSEDDGDVALDAVATPLPQERPEQARRQKEDGEQEIQMAQAPRDDTSPATRPT
ncbi:Cadmium resistance transporter [Moelleriella libera RCEF 2490]|uniref:Cadmium resistance transporter n=1 Tax=Moelleriella libera RCEF 2490 TaxID=1081109 RepID=A0A166PA11_9HYPO|nr:Cadmium resistance transporter [Moelleriella libera RCEF 2490]